jgi:uncharacterized membrane protein YgcG
MIETLQKKEGEHMRFLIHHKASQHWLVLLFIGTCLFGILLPAQARAASGTIADDAQVLNSTAIQQYTAPFSYTVDIFTTNVFQGSNGDFDASVQGLTSNDTNTMMGSCDPPTHQVGCELFSTNTLPAPDGTAGPTTNYQVRNGDPNKSVEIGIDVPARHIAIYSGSSVTLPQDHYGKAIQSFTNTMHQTHDNYTQATIAALNALQSASDRFWNGVRAALPWIFGGALLIGIFIFSIVARSLGWSSGRSSRYYGWGRDGGWGGGGGDFGGGGSGGGGGGASGNF